MPTSDAPSSQLTVRAPAQERTRVSWERILDVGTRLLEEEGFEALTISAVCREAQVSPPTIYARVDGLAGLFWAIYDRGMTAVLATQAADLRAAARTPPGSRERISAVVAAGCAPFIEHERFLRPVIRFASSNEALLARGAASSQALVDEMTGLLTHPSNDGAEAVARMIYAECVFRTMYGDHFLGHSPESPDEFRERISGLAMARLLAY
jgi:AcrR family transcriptional regulator